VLFVVLFLGCAVRLFSQDEEEEPRAVAFPRHTLGDQSLGINAGLLIPLFFKEFSGPYHSANLSLGGTGNLQWNAYLSAFWKIGLEIAGGFTFGVNLNTLLMLPLTLKVSYLISAGRFEFPVFLGIGINVIRYREWSHLDFVAKPGIGAYWRFDHNWSFGLALEWWLDFQYIDPAYQDVGQARMANFLGITPSLIYNF
jgi:hypothetical protein